VWEEFDSVCNVFRSSAADVAMIVAVVFGCSNEIPLVNTIGVKCTTLSCFLMYKHSCARRGKGRAIEVENTIELSFSR
jgi:hypothetical protein